MVIIEKETDIKIFEPIRIYEKESRPIAVIIQ